MLKKIFIISAIFLFCMILWKLYSIGPSAREVAKEAMIILPEDAKVREFTQLPAGREVQYVATLSITSDAEKICEQNKFSRVRSEVFPDSSNRGNGIKALQSAGLCYGRSDLSNGVALIIVKQKEIILYVLISA
jgi:hypothetical protein